MSLKNKIGNYKDTAVVSFAQSIIDKLRTNPIYTYSKEDISKSKFPDKECVFCGQCGCDKKHSGHFVHNKCVEYTNTEVLKRKWQLNKR